MSVLRWYAQEHRLGTWELGAPTTDVLDVIGTEPEDFARIGVTPPPRLDSLLRR